jgi:hypothetical protein
MLGQWPTEFTALAHLGHRKGAFECDIFSRVGIDGRVPLHALNAPFVPGVGTVNVLGPTSSENGAFMRVWLRATAPLARYVVDAPSVHTRHGSMSSRTSWLRLH